MRFVSSSAVNARVTALFRTAAAVVVSLAVTSQHAEAQGGRSAGTIYPNGSISFSPAPDAAVTKCKFTITIENAVKNGQYSLEYSRSSNGSDVVADVVPLGKATGRGTLTVNGTGRNASGLSGVYLNAANIGNIRFVAVNGDGRWESADSRWKVTDTCHPA
jgi:hypothetical protein